MMLNPIKIDTLPKLSWCAVMERHRDLIDVLCGPWVETNKNSVCEGAWSGDFSERNFESNYFMGTGLKLNADSLLAVTPDHTLDRIHVIKNENTLLISNSLNFLLAQSGDDLDSRFLLYDSLVASITDGLKKYTKTIPTKNKNRVHYYYYCNIEIDTELTLRETQKKQTHDFINFDDYVAFLERHVTAIHDNANDPMREIKYPPITTISNGYDSPVAALFAKKVGCKEAVTFTHARGVDHPNDSGDTIAAILGLKAKAYDRLAYRNRTDFPEAENSGGPNEFLSFGEDLNGRLVFTGFQGGRHWNRITRTIKDDIIRGDAAGFSFTEYRLRSGFIHFPLPFLGCTNGPSIQRISNSDEMKPWILMNNYDRPIPRRLLEEAGVERNLFGQRKKAAGIVVSEEGIRQTLSAKSLEDFEHFIKENWNSRMQLKSWSVLFIMYLIRINRLINRLIKTIFLNTIGKDIDLPILIPHQLQVLTYGYFRKDAMLFHWGARKIIPRYKIKSRRMDRGQIGSIINWDISG